MTPQVTLGVSMGAGGYSSVWNSTIARCFVSTWPHYPDSTLRRVLTALTTKKDMSVGICGGRPQTSKRETIGEMLMSFMTVFQCALKTLSQTIAAFLITMLANAMQRVQHWKSLSQCRAVKRPEDRPVYDLMNCGPRNRFVVHGGTIAHNCLGLGYGMRPKKMVKQCYDNGHTMDYKTAEAFFNAYWQLFSGVRRLSDSLAARVQQQGFIVNPFGYRLTPPPHKAFNYMIQSTVSGIMNAFVAKLMAIAPYAVFDTIIHDELVADVPIEKLDDFRVKKDMATDSLNAELGWSVNIRTGFSVGQSWYEAK